MNITARETLKRNIGQKSEKEIFTKGKTYYYLAAVASWQSHKVQCNDGCGLPVEFNEKDFRKYFKL